MKDNKHPHYDLIVELIGDTSKQAQMIISSNLITNVEVSSVVVDDKGQYTFRIKPREFIKGHWYPCIDEDGESRVFVFAGDHFKFHLQTGGSNVQMGSMQWIGESLGEIKFGE